MEGDVVVHGLHGQRGALEDVVLADLQQMPVGRDAADSRLQLVICERVQAQVNALLLGLQGQQCMSVLAILLSEKGGQVTLADAMPVKNHGVPLAQTLTAAFQLCALYKRRLA